MADDSRLKTLQSLQSAAKKAHESWSPNGTRYGPDADAFCFIFSSLVVILDSLIESEMSVIEFADKIVVVKDDPKPRNKRSRVATPTRRNRTSRRDAK